MPQSAQILQLDIIGDDIDERAARRKMLRVMEQAALRPHGMPPESILCVRHFHDPLPGTLLLGVRRGRAVRQWQAAANAALTRLYRQAHAPAHGPVPPSAQAVLFRDQAEVLACLTRDWLTGRVLGRWWWQRWLQKRPIAEAVTHTWLEHLVDVPPAFAQLEEPYRVSFVQKLPPPILERLTRALVQTFAIPTLILAEEASLPPKIEPGIPAEQEELRPDEKSLTTVDDQPASAEPTVSDLPFSLDWAPEIADPSLTMAQRRFLIVVTGLVRRPRLIRQRPFAQFVVDALATAPRPPERESGDGPATAVSPQKPIAKQTLPETPPDRDSMAMSAATVPESRYDGGVGGETAVIPPTTAPPTLPAVPLMEEVAPVVAFQEIETAFGGLFYVINILLALKIYGDFSTPREPGLELPLWDFLALLGESWFGEAFHEDDLWAWLAQMAERPLSQRPGHDIPAPDVWRLPPRALQAFPETAVLPWRVAAERLLVWHPARFWVLDVPVEGEIATQLATETSVFSPAITLVADDELVTPDGTAVGWPRWFNWFLPYLTVRLKRAFAADDPPFDTLCRYPARITWTNTHLNVHFTLDDINLSLRQAGLDRNPGWVPIAGRFVAFHFD